MVTRQVMVSLLTVSGLWTLKVRCVNSRSQTIMSVSILGTRSPRLLSVPETPQTINLTSMT